ncbi:MAG: hydroxylamine reductase [Melioribacteraceae bacterium]|nr:MAG: hydroxylamine reductase [Melioribacteraceae bacterium]
MEMFCNQCQEALQGEGCTIAGVCGKSASTSNLQNLYTSMISDLARLLEFKSEINLDTKIYDHFITEALFSTITNVNFEDEYFLQMIHKTRMYRDEVIGLLNANKVDIDLSHFINLPEEDREINTLAQKVATYKHNNPDIQSLRELLLYGLKGMAAYHFHAMHLGYESEEIYRFQVKGMAALKNDNLSGDELTALVLETGKYGVEVMALLDKANTETYGNPEITSVKTGVKNNPGILVSGHDLKDLEQLLVQTEGTGVDVYTHSEMLPAHYYPKFKKFEHFVGNYGNAWWQQDQEFADFNGPVLMTTNCLVPPRKEYKDRVFTTGPVGFPGLKHIEADASGNKDYTALIELAKTCEPPVQIEDGEIVGGFAHNAVLSLADKVIDAVKSGAVKKFIVMAGCDGRMNSRDYYTEFAKGLNKESIILTAGCAKYRYNKLPLGDIGGIPRVLDAGQCNDSYSLAVIALKLKEVFELEDINDLPISYNIAWYEQKAVIVLLALLHLGVKNIHLGPTLPAFLSPNVANILVETFGIGGIGEVEEDIAMMSA